jgi:hypothetical protein
MKAMRLFTDSKSGALKTAKGFSVIGQKEKFDLLLGSGDGQRIIPLDRNNTPAIVDTAAQNGKHFVYSVDLHLFHDRRMSKLIGTDVRYYFLTKAESDFDLRLCLHLDLQGSTGIQVFGSSGYDDLPCGNRHDNEGFPVSQVTLVVLSPGEYFVVEFGDRSSAVVRYDVAKGLLIEERPAEAMA